MVTYDFIPSKQPVSTPTLMGGGFSFRPKKGSAPRNKPKSSLASQGLQGSQPLTSKMTESEQMTAFKQLVDVGQQVTSRRSLILKK